MATAHETWIDLGSRICKGFEIDPDRDRDEPFSVRVAGDRLVVDGYFHDSLGGVEFVCVDNAIDPFEQGYDAVRYGTPNGWMMCSCLGEPLISVSFGIAPIDGENRRVVTIEGDFYGEDGRLVIHATRGQFEILEPDRVSFRELRVLA